MKQYLFRLRKSDSYKGQLYQDVLLFLLIEISGIIIFVLTKTWYHMFMGLIPSFLCIPHIINLCKIKKEHDYDTLIITKEYIMINENGMFKTFLWKRIHNISIRYNRNYAIGNKTLDIQLKNGKHIQINIEDYTCSYNPIKLKFAIRRCLIQGKKNNS